MVAKIVFITLIALAVSTKLTIGLESYEKQCFYEILRTSWLRQSHNKSIRLMSIQKVKGGTRWK